MNWIECFGCGCLYDKDIHEKCPLCRYDKGIHHKPVNGVIVIKHER